MAHRGYEVMTGYLCAERYDIESKKQKTCHMCAERYEAGSEKQTNVTDRREPKFR